MHRSRIIALLTLAIVILASTPVLGSPLSEKRAQAEAARDAVAQVDIELEMASEDYNEARNAYEEINAQVAANEAKLTELNAEIGTLESHIGSRAESMYRNGPLGLLEVLLGANSFTEFAATWDFLRDLSARESVQAAALRETREEAEATEATLEEQRAAAKVEFDTMASRKSEIESRLAERTSILSGLEDEVAALEAAERRAAEAAAAAARSSYTSRADTGGDPARAPRSEVVNIAKQYLGVPYRWGGSGPNSFDCSGLTMYVYAKVGVSLPHSSRAQYNCGERVSRANLAPGDLVFFGSPIHHVGIYVGNGQYIHAPHTGAVVRIDPLNRYDYVGACRP